MTAAVERLGCPRPLSLHGVNHGQVFHREGHVGMFFAELAFANGEASLERAFRVCISSHAAIDEAEVLQTSCDIRMILAELPLPDRKASLQQRFGFLVLSLLGVE